MRILIPLLLAATMLFTGCASRVARKAPPSLPAGPWALVELNEKPVTVVNLSQQPTMLFDAEGGRVSGHAGVNRYNGSYTQNGTAMSFGPAATTKMAGPPELMRIEEEFLAMLPKVKSWRIETAWLQLIGDKGVILARLVLGPGQTQSQGQGQGQ